MSFRRALLVAALIAALPASGCQLLSASVKSPLDSLSGTGRAIAGSFEAISTSSGAGGAASAAYVRDLRQYVGVFLRGDEGTSQDFQRGVSRIAESHGITHWEADAATPYAIGQGLREAGLDETQMRVFCDAVGADRESARIALQGWREAGS